MTHSKMNNVHYKCLNIQEYFNNTSFNIQTKQQIFSYRVRMAEVGENFCGVRPSVPCPLGCDGELDTQQHSYECNAIKSKIVIKGKYSDIFQDVIPVHAGKDVSNIIRERKRLLEEKFLEYSVFNN